LVNPTTVAPNVRVAFSLLLEAGLLQIGYKDVGELNYLVRKLRMTEEDVNTEN
jgi:hypothetical protein